MKTQRRRQKCLYDCHANETRFCLNYSVWLAMPRRQKLDRDWEGPYLTVEVMEPQTYRVRHQEQKRKSKSKSKSEQKLTGGTFCTDEAVRRQRVCLRPVFLCRDHQGAGTLVACCPLPTIIRMRVGRPTRR
ncbi:hypothetical protein T08_11901 [Trichinella sp. T8]|nr:hypothetical protein T08_11901 [Trichinella sp. T8]